MFSLTFLTRFHSHFYANFHEFYEAANISQLSLILLIFIYLNWQSNSLRQYQFFPNFDSPNAFFPNSAGPWTHLQNGKNIPDDNAYGLLNVCKKVSGVLGAK